jgi:voltage-gated potassium channel
MTLEQSAHRRITQAHWRKRADIPLTIAAAIFIVVYAWDVIADLKGRADFVAQVIMWIVWGVFVVDYIVNLILAERRVHWFFRHILEFLSVALPALRPLRLLRLVTLLSVLERSAGRALRGRILIYAGGVSVIIIFVSSLAELDAERGQPGSTIHNFGDAIWWACTTITTVGYGDVYPVTFVGRVIAIGVMAAGLALLGTVTATLASFFIDRVEDTSKIESDETQAALSELSKQVAQLRVELREAQSRKP